MSSPGRRTIALFAHATGLCKETWRPVYAQLEVDTLAFDFKGHGAQGADPIALGETWDTFSVADVLRAAALAPPGARLVGIGHSFGGAALLKAELAAPGTFAALVLCEPILLGEDVDPLADPRANMAARAAKRVASWPTAADAVCYLRSRPMFAGFKKLDAPRPSN